MASQVNNLILEFEELKKKYGHTQEFKDFEKKHSRDIDFIKFKKENGIRWTKKNGWNKPFINNLKTIWIKKGKTGHYQNVENGWKLVDNNLSSKCKWCGKILIGRQTSSCSDLHKTYFHRVLKRGKEICNFDIKKNYHVLLIPRVWQYDINKNGHLETKQLRKKDIKFSEIEFSINGIRYPLTLKTRRF